MKRELPNRLIRLMNESPSVNVENRTIDADVATRLLARDGGILLPDGIDTRAFAQNPNVLVMHGFLEGVFPIAGRCTALVQSARGIMATTQFAETRLGEEIGYLYGVNPKKEVYCRGWSFGWRSYETDWISIDEAKALLGSDFDPTTVDPSIERNGVWVCKRGEMHEYSPVPVGADRAGLSRAYKDGVDTAAAFIADFDLKEARQQIRDMRDNATVTEGKVAKLEREWNALRRDEAAAAARGDTAAFVEALRELTNRLK